jgi:anhydro-N-acetylmuramic acid kinase
MISAKLIAKDMIAAGVMSGTSADGIDVALVRVSTKGRETKSGDPADSRVKLLGQAHFSYPAPVRRAVLGMMNSNCASVAEISRLQVLLGELYADAVLETQKKLRTKAELIGCHGQTVYHQGDRANFLGKQLAVTWQLGEGARIAARVGVPVVSDFRPADMAVGGKGAPLVPYLDYLLYRDARIGRIALNLGGIANVTAIPAGAGLRDVLAFDTGPGNMVIDTLTEKSFHKPYDRDGRIAARSRVFDNVVADYLRQPYFRRRPPKTTGREEFGREFAQEFHRACGRSRVSPGAKRGVAAKNADVIATATWLTVCSIADAIKRFILPRGKFSELVASGGGTRNRTLMLWLEDALRPLGLRLRTSDEFGIPSEAKEAVAFAVLAYETWNQRPSNVPSATGARRPAVLGKVSYP